MSKTYTITVINNSGSSKNYALFNEAPRNPGMARVKMQANVLAVAKTPPGQQGHCSFQNEYSDICGSFQGRPADRVPVTLSGGRSVTLGTISPTGTQAPGTSLSFTVKDGSPQFEDRTMTAGGYVGAFEIQTSDTFDVQEADRENYMIGLGLSSTGGNKASATFVPEPRKNYQIQPVHIYYLTFGDYVQGSIIDVSKAKAPKEIDFYMNLADVTVIHDENGNLNIQRR